MTACFLKDGNEKQYWAIVQALLTSNRMEMLLKSNLPNLDEAGSATHKVKKKKTLHHSGNINGI